MELAIFIAIVVSIAVVFLVSAYSGTHAKQLKPKPALLTQAEQLLAKNEYTLSVLKGFTALEKCLQSYGQGSTFELIELAKNKSILSTESVSTAHQLRLIRNQIAHDGNTTNANDAHKIIKQIRLLISELGYQTL